MEPGEQDGQRDPGQQGQPAEPSESPPELEMVEVPELDFTTDSNSEEEEQEDGRGSKGDDGEGQGQSEGEEQEEGGKGPQNQGKQPGMAQEQEGSRREQKGEGGAGGTTSGEGEILKVIGGVTVSLTEAVPWEEDPNILLCKSCEGFGQSVLMHDTITVDGNSPVFCACFLVSGFASAQRVLSAASSSTLSLSPSCCS
jgi:hypothetical protein